VINVLFFARLKDTIGQAELKLETEHAGKTAAELQQILIAKGMVALQDDSIRIAVNQNFCSADAIVNDGDEVAFMPPVTGG
jgi:molybdopterin synthase sulfur carrier subunit|tara:strand:- start:3629 stop:3871 length:243 start_codon:yes stop_codon:yes gene_type:complete